MYRINRLKIYLVLFLFFIIDTVWMDRFAVNDARPDLLIIFVIFFGFFYGRGLGLEVGLVSGLLKDALGIGFFGTNIIIFGLLGFTAEIISEGVVKDNVLTQFMFAFIATFFISNFYMSHALYTSLLAPVVIAVLRLLFGSFPLTFMTNQ